MEDMGYVLERFNVFICVIEFGFSSAASCNALTFRYPIERGTHPNSETGYSPRFEEIHIFCFIGMW